MNTVSHPPRRERGLKWYLDVTISCLGNCYMHLKPGTSADDFVHEILKVVAANDDPSADDPMEIMMSCISDEDRAKGPDWIASSPYGSIIVGTAYYHRSDWARRAGDMGLAWSLMADARFWAGVAISAKGIGDARERTIATVKRERGAVGAAGKVKTYEPIIQFAYKMVLKRKPPQNGWRSRSHAVKAIKSVVLRFAQRKSVRMSHERAGKTIDGWLAKMPDATALFPRQKDSKRKNGALVGI